MATLVVPTEQGNVVGEQIRQPEAASPSASSPNSLQTTAPSSPASSTRRWTDRFRVVVPG